MQIFCDEVSDAPPSRPGFESDAEQSAQTFGVPFPDVTDPSTPFPATLIQDNAQQDQERFAASAHPSGLSARVDNIVRAFQMHGPLDRELLSKALNDVASLHPLLSATFQQSRDRLYIKTSHGTYVRFHALFVPLPIVSTAHCGGKYCTVYCLYSCISWSVVCVCPVVIHTLASFEKEMNTAVPDSLKYE